jgi:hypothetical protein
LANTPLGFFFIVLVLRKIDFCQTKPINIKIKIFFFCWSRLAEKKKVDDE